MFSDLAADGPAPIFGRFNARDHGGTYWKCHIGNRVHLARERAWGRDADNRPAMTRGILARKLGITAHRLWEIEVGILPIDGVEIARIAQTLDFHPGALFDDAPLENWKATSRGTPAWLMAATVGQLKKHDRDLVEAIVIRLEERRGGRPS